jgi:hypothetical protein
MQMIEHQAVLQAPVHAAEQANRGEHLAAIVVREVGAVEAGHRRADTHLKAQPPPATEERRAHVDAALKAEAAGAASIYRTAERRDAAKDFRPLASRTESSPGADLAELAAIAAAGTVTMKVIAVEVIAMELSANNAGHDLLI